MWLPKQKTTLRHRNIVLKGVSTHSPLHFKIIPPLLGSPHPPNLPANQSAQAFLINRYTTEKLRLINTIHVKQQHVGIFIFKFTLKYMFGDVYNN